MQPVIERNIALVASGKDGYIIERKPVSTKLVPTKLTGQVKEWELNGVDDNQPQDLFDDVKSVGVLARGLLARRNLHYGKGLVPYKLSVTEGNELQRELHYTHELLSFMRANNASVRQAELVRQLEHYSQVYVEIILNINRTRVVSFKPIDYRFVRLAHIDPNAGRPLFAYISADFVDQYAANDNVVAVPTLDMDRPLEHLKAAKSNKFIAVFRYEDGDLTYPTPTWNALRVSKWLDNVKNIPTIKDAIYNNQLTLKYHIQVSDIYLKERFPKWDSLKTEQEREEKLKTLLDEIDKHLKGAKNSGKSIISLFNYDEITHKEIEGVKITPIKQELADGMFNMDTADGNSQILFTVGLNPAILGHGVPGGKELSGSGSDIREAMLAHLAQLGPERVVSTNLWRIISDFNGWEEFLEWGYIDMDTSQTLDKNPTGSKETLS